MDWSEQTKQHVIDYCRDIEIRENTRFRLNGVAIEEIVEHNRKHPEYTEERTREAIAQLISEGILKEWNSTLFAGPDWTSASQPS
jgi:hypothetical protein